MDLLFVVLLLVCVCVSIFFIAKDTINHTKAYIQATRLDQEVKTTDLPVAKDCLIVINP